MGELVQVGRILHVVSLGKMELYDALQKKDKGVGEKNQRHGKREWEWKEEEVTE